MRLPIAFLLCLLLPATAFCEGRGSETASWPSKSTSHFLIKHESAMAPQAIAMELERIYSKMRMHMAAFAPWMAKEKTKIYIYSTKDSYKASSFEPPPWSEAIAMPQLHAVVIYDLQDISQIRRVLTHELSHLFFGSFFVSRPDTLPLWLDEGMATNMEDVVLGFREEALLQSDIKSYPAFDKFTASTPGVNDPDAVVRGWYLQAFGTVKFMYGTSNKLKFVVYCKKLLAGSTPEKALWEVYKIRNWTVFDERWRNWLENEQRESRGEPSSSPSSGFTRNKGFSSSSFFR